MSTEVGQALRRSFRTKKDEFIVITIFTSCCLTCACSLTRLRAVAKLVVYSLQLLGRLWFAEMNKLLILLSALLCDALTGSRT